tara:strand:+ start:373 stop:636 length:264 start_codon:yes stop_codon:yes gene_type:complete
MKPIIKFEDDELNCINVCLDHFIEDNADAFKFDFYPCFPFKHEELHQGKKSVSVQLETYSDFLKKLSIAVRTLNKIKKLTEIQKKDN